jgi:hypothetical protein
MTLLAKIAVGIAVFVVIPPVLWWLARQWMEIMDNAIVVARILRGK